MKSDSGNPQRLACIYNDHKNLSLERWIVEHTQRCNNFLDAAALQLAAEGQTQCHV